MCHTCRLSTTALALARLVTFNASTKSPRFPGITERAGALEKVRERDGIIDARIIASCRELGLRCEVVDGSRNIAATLALVEEHFRRRLGGRPHV